MACAACIEWVWCVVCGWHDEHMLVLLLTGDSAHSLQQPYRVASVPELEQVLWDFSPDALEHVSDRVVNVERPHNGLALRIRLSILAASFADLLQHLAYGA